MTRVAAVLLLALQLVCAPPVLAFDARLKLPLTLTKEQALEEIDMVVRILRTMHPGVYQYRSQKAFDTLVANSRREVTGPVNVADHYLRLSRIMASVCDSHTRIDLLHRDNNLFSPGMEFFADGLVLAEDEELYIPYVSVDRAVRAISGVSADSVINSLRKHLSIDACADEQRLFDSIETRLILTAMLGDQDHLFTFGPGDSPPSVRNSASISRIHTALTINQVFGINKYELKKKGFDECETVETQLLCRDTANSLTFLRFWSFSMKNPEETIDQIFNKILANGDDDLVVDLQNNPGGSTYTMSYFLSYLLKRSHRIARHAHVRSTKVEAADAFTWSNKDLETLYKDNARGFRRAGRRNGVYTLNIGRRSFGHPHFRGRITVLVNEQTYSAAVMAAQILRNQRKAKIVGLPPAGAGDYSCAAAFGTYRLPHSGLHADVPFWCHSNNRAYRTKKSKRLQPDITVPLTRVNSKAHQFAVLYAALADLGKTSQPGVLQVARAPSDIKIRAKPRAKPEVASGRLRNSANPATSAKSVTRPIAPPVSTGPVTGIFRKPAGQSDRTPMVRILVRSLTGIKSARAIDGQEVCFVTSTPAEKVLKEFSKRNAIDLKFKGFAEFDMVKSQFTAGDCTAVAASPFQIRQIRKLQPDPGNHLMLPENLATADWSKEAQGTKAEDESEPIVILLPSKQAESYFPLMRLRTICMVRDSEAEKQVMRITGRTFDDDQLQPDRSAVASRFRTGICAAAVGPLSEMNELYESLADRSQHTILPGDLRQSDTMISTFR